MRATVTVAAVTAGSASAASNWVVVDRFPVPTNIAVFVVVSGTANYTIQHTPSNVGLVGTSGVRVFNHETLVTLASSEDGNYAFPPAAIRLMSNPVTGASGNVEMTLIQSGN